MSQPITDAEIIAIKELIDNAKAEEIEFKRWVKNLGLSIKCAKIMPRLLGERETMLELLRRAAPGQGVERKTDLQLARLYHDIRTYLEAVKGER